MTTFNTLAESKTESKKFKKNDYVISMERNGALITGELLQFGYLQASFSVGAPRGWFVRKYSMMISDFEKAFDIKANQKTVKI